MTAASLRSVRLRASALALVAFTASPLPAQEPPTSLQFGRARLENVSVARGAVARRTVALKNPGAAPARIVKVTVQGAPLGVTLVRQRVAAPVALDTAMEYEIPAQDAVNVELAFDASGDPDLPLGERSSTVAIEAGGSTLELPVEWEVVESRSEKDEERPIGRPRTDLSEWAPKGPPPVLKCDRYLHDFSRVFSGERLRTTFTIRNDGESDLVIIKIGTQCHCTLPRLTLPGREVTKKELMRDEVYGALKPGEEATLEVEVDTAGMGGFVRKSIEIVTNDAVRSPQRLSMTLTVDNPFEFSPATARFGEVHRGERVERVIRVVSKTQGKFAITGYELPQPQALDVEYREVKARKDEQCAWELVLTSRGDLPCREYIGRVRLAIDHERIKSVDQLHYQLRVVPDVQWTLESQQRKSPESFSLGVVRPGLNDVQTILFENTSPATPWIPTEAKIVSKLGSEPYEAEIIELEKGVRYEVKIKVVSAPRAKAFKGELHLKAESASLPELKIAFSGIWAGPTAAPAAAPAATPAKEEASGK